MNSTRTIQITSKAKADSILVDSLFRPVNGKTLNREKYCTGKYKPDAFPVGREMEVPATVHAIYVTKGRDNEGAYATLMCITER